MPPRNASAHKVLKGDNLSLPHGVHPRPVEPVGDERFGNWLSFLTAVRGLAPSTLERYATTVRRYLDALSGAPDRGSIELYLKGRRLQRLGDSAIRQELAAIRSYCEWAAGNGHLPSNPALHLKGPRSYRKEASCLTVDEVRRLLLGGAVTRDRSTVTRDSVSVSDPVEMRDRVLLGLMYFCGLRASEPGQLRAEDVIYEPGTGGRYSILIRDGKWADGDRRIELEAVGSRLLGVYLPLRAKVAPKDSPWLFPSWRGTALHRSSVLRIFRNRLRQAGIEARGRKLTPHTLRHSIASHMLADGRFDVRQVQEHLRHQDVRTTMRYIHTSAAAARKAWMARHPWREVDRSESLAKEAMAAVRGLGSGNAP